MPKPVSAVLLIVFSFGVFIPGGLTTSLAAQVQLGTVRGQVLQPDGTPAADAQVNIVDSLGQLVTKSVTMRDGRFELTGIAPGTYQLRAGGAGFSTLLRPLIVEGALPIEIEIQLPPAVKEEVVVQGSADEAPAVTTRVSIAGDVVERMPSRLRGRGVQGAVATIPGWSTEDNGLLHVRGVDDGLLYVMDGVPIQERLDGLFGIAPDPAMIDSMHVLTGYIPPEFGLKSGGVVEVRSKANLADRWAGNVEFGAGSRRTQHVSGLAGGPVSSRATLTSGLSAERSASYLDSVDPDFLHTQGSVESGGVQLAWNPAVGHSVSAIAGFAASRYEVPNTAEQEAAGQDQRQRLRQYWQTASWQRTWSSTIVSQVAGYARQTTGVLRGSPFDTPIQTDADRSLRRVGVLASVTRQWPGHLLKTGGEISWLRLKETFQFAVAPGIIPGETDLTDAALAFTPGSPFHFHGTAQPTLWSFYIQDSVRPVDRLSLDLGVRVDRSRLLVAATEVSPRLGLSYHWPRTDTTVRGSFSRFFQPPQAENLLLASSAEGRALSPFDVGSGDATGGADIEPERQNAVEIGVAQRLASMRLDVAYWDRRVRNAADPNVFFGTTIVFPNAVARGRASGIDVRLELPRRKAVSAYLSYTNSRVVQFGPIVGGLFLEDDVADIAEGGAFTPDHDQRNVAAAGVTYDHAATGAWMSLSGRYESGTPLEAEATDLDDLQARPGAARVDFARMRVRPRRVVDAEAGARLLRRGRIDLSARAAILNLFDQAYAYNFGNPFSGTHFGPGRTLSVSVRTAF
jgi:outer membrane receptor protein involved in Fe transport